MDIKKLRDKQKRLTDSINQEQLNLEKISEDRKVLEELFTKDKGAHDKLVKDIDALEVKLDNLNKKVVKESVDFEENKRILADFDKKEKTKRDDFIKVEEEIKEKTEALKVSMDKKKEKADKELEGKKLVLEGLSFTIEEANEELKKSADFVKALEDVIDKSKEEIAELVGELESLNGDVAEKENSLAGVNTEISEAKNKLKELKAEIVEAEKEGKRAVSESKKLIIAKDEAQAEVDGLLKQKIAFGEEKAQFKEAKAELLRYYKQAGLPSPFDN